MATKIRQSNLTQPLDQDLSVPGITSSGNISLADSAKVMLGDDNNTQVYHNGTNTYFDNYTGNLYFSNYSNDRSIQFATDDGSGGLTAYVLLNGSDGSVTLNHYGSQKLVTSNTGISVTGDVVASGNLSGVDATFSGDLSVSGDFTVSGNTTFVNSDNLVIEDLNIVLANGAADATAANGAGITVDGANAQITYDGTNDEWDFNKNLNVSGSFPKITLTETDNSSTYTMINQNFGYLTIDNDAGGTDAGHGIIFKMDQVEATRITQDKDVTWNESNGGTPQVGMHWDYNDGRLGIGNDAITPSAGVSASAKGLHIAHENVPFLALDNTTATTGKKYTLYSNTSGDLVFYDVTDGKTSIIVDTSGKVGIGTSTPTTQLQIDNLNANTGGNAWISTISNAGQYSGIKLARGDGDWSNNLNNNYGIAVTDNGLEFSKFTSTGDNQTGRATYLQIDEDGDIGIGTNNPQYALHLISSDNQPMRITSPNSNVWLDLESSSGVWSIGSTSQGTGTFAVYGDRDSTDPTPALVFQVDNTGAAIGRNYLPSTRNALDVNGDIGAEGTYKLDEAMVDISPTRTFNFVNTRRLDSEIDFRRDSEATYWSGKKVRGENNLLLNATALQNWTQQGVTTNANTNETKAPDGTETATKVTGNGNNVHHVVFQYFQYPEPVQYVASVWLKAGTTTNAFLQIANEDAANRYSAYINLTTGAIQSEYNHGEDIYDFRSTSTSYGNGWWRIEVTARQQAQNGIYVVLGSADSADVPTIGNTAGYSQWADTGYFYAWGGQLEYGDKAGTLVKTTSSAIVTEQPVLEVSPMNKPRFEIDPVTGKSMGWLIEDTSRNLCPWSNHFDSTYTGFWTQSGAGIVKNVATGFCSAASRPYDEYQGYVSATRLQEDSSNGQHFIYGGMTFAANTVYTWSIFAKADTRSKFQLSEAGVTGVSATFDLLAGTATIASQGSGGNTMTSEANIEPVGNGWYRCSVHYRTSTGGTGAAHRIQLLNDSGSSSYVGEYGKGIYIYGAQLEEGSLPSSLIITSGNSWVREGDYGVIENIRDKDWFEYDLSLYIEASEKAVNTYTGSLERHTVLSLLDKDGGYSMGIGKSNAGGGEEQIQVFTYLNQATQTYVVGNSPTGLTENEYWKAYIYLGTNDSSIILNGGSIANDTIARSPTETSDRLVFGTRGFDADGDPNENTHFGHIRKINFYPYELSDAQKTNLTEKG